MHNSYSFRFVDLVFPIDPSRSKFQLNQLAKNYQLFTSLHPGADHKSPATGWMRKRPLVETFQSTS